MTSRHNEQSMTIGRISKNTQSVLAQALEAVRGTAGLEGAATDHFRSGSRDKLGRRLRSDRDFRRCMVRPWRRSWDRRSLRRLIADNGASWTKPSARQLIRGRDAMRLFDAIQYLETRLD